VSAQVAAPGRPYPPPACAEPVWPAELAIVAAIVLQVTLPDSLRLGPRYAVPVLEALLIVGLLFLTPRRLEGRHRRRRQLALVLISLVSLANAASLALLAHQLLHPHGNTVSGRQLILSGTLIWLTNVIIFGLWYWELDRGGPGQRAAAEDGPPDFLFPQMTDDRVEPLNWRPQFLDYLYVALTNATAFSPTDTMPLSIAAKSTMGLQAMVSLVTLGLVVSRAVNILS
jgi:uncharacterized membrane protein